ncbi:MAG TPA: hypothetical protein PKE21_12525 [Flavobacteriales bacterium]|nr:hypothetical protein [Flavobacteriales bacterium]HMR28299.1 hypothetical protein [Flavobacteriales bacterium]
MATEKIKLDIVKRVLALKDETALVNLHDYLAAEPAAPWGDLPKEVRASLERSLEQLDRGEGRSHEDVMANARSWSQASGGRRKPRRVPSK